MERDALKRLVEMARTLRSPPGWPRPPEAELERAAREALFIPDFYPPVSELIPGRDGTLWIRREATWDADDTDTWQILGPRGDLLRTLTSPKTIGRIMAVDARGFWAVERGELDVPYVVRYSLGGPTGS